MSEREERVFTCINCPMGCTIKVKIEDDEIASISGSDCKAGEKYVKAELENPTRVLTSTVKVKNGVLPRVPVKSNEELPKGDILKCVRRLDDVEVEAPVDIHTTVVEDILGTGADIVTTRSLERREGKKGEI